MDLSDWLSVIALVVSFASLAVTAWLNSRMSASQIDDNIMNEVNSTLALLEKVKKLDTIERRLMVRLLNDWDYFDPPKFIKKRGCNIPSDETIEKLREYFNELAEASSGGDKEKAV